MISRVFLSNNVDNFNFDMNNWCYYIINNDNELLTLKKDLIYKCSRRKPSDLREAQSLG